MEEEVIELLARWVYELRVDLEIQQWRLREQDRRLRQQEQRLAGYAFWMRTGMTPAEIHTASRELDPAAAT